MSEGPVYCPDCKDPTSKDFALMYTDNGYQCPNCKFYWDGRFPIKMSIVQKGTIRLR